jgi:hypothetical protein
MCSTAANFSLTIAASMSALERQSFHEPARSSCKAIAAISMAMSSDGARSSGSESGVE